MDYRTKPASRNTLRKLSHYLRATFDVNDNEPFPVLRVLEQIPDKFENCSVEILDNSCFPKNVKARCIPNDQDGFTIQIQESIYKGAYEKKIGAYLGFICHEICHVFLFKIGYRPIYERSFRNNELRAYESVEWQAKALCGEVMMPFEATCGKSVNRIMSEYHVSKGFAQMRQKYK